MLWLSTVSIFIFAFGRQKSVSRHFFGPNRSDTSTLRLSLQLQMKHLSSKTSLAVGSYAQKTYQLFANNISTCQISWLSILDCSICKCESTNTLGTHSDRTSTKTLSSVLPTSCPNSVSTTRRNFVAEQWCALIHRMLHFLVLLTVSLSIYPRTLLISLPIPLPASFCSFAVSSSMLDWHIDFNLYICFLFPLKCSYFLHLKI